jgi:hypothetical protein
LRLVTVVAAQLEVVAQLRTLALELQAQPVQVLHYSLVQTAVLVLELEQQQVHCLLSDVVLR